MNFDSTHTRMPNSTRRRMKKWYDRHIIRHTFEPGQKILLFNPHLKLFSSKLRSKWSGPYTVVNMMSYGVVELGDEATNQYFLVNC